MNSISLIQSAKMSSTALGPAVPTHLPPLGCLLWTRGWDEQRLLAGIPAASQATRPGVVQQRAASAVTVLWGQLQICDCTWLLNEEEMLSEERGFPIWTHNKGPM